MFLPVWLSASCLAFVVGSLAEYWGHRSMHAWFKRARHVEHHRSGANQGFAREFFGYARGSWPFFAAGLLHSGEAGVGFAAGGLVFSAFAAYAHELQHEHPECCFWLSTPVHHIHHTEEMWEHNFGITFDVWDRVFGTYRRTDYQHPANRSWRKLFRVKWL